MKTRAMQILDDLGIKYEVKTFEFGKVGTDDVVEKLRIPHEQVFKTLVTKGDRTGIMLACVPGPKQLDLKLLAKASGNKECAMFPKEHVERVTGYVTGGCSPLGSKRNLPLYIDKRCEGLPFISVSAGMRGMQIFIAPADLIRAAGAIIAELTRD
jgi:Cys-tRNA(Pro)/Cys-tRNA(Cys) deacylase